MMMMMMMMMKTNMQKMMVLDDKKLREASYSRCCMARIPINSLYRGSIEFKLPALGQ